MHSTVPAMQTALMMLSELIIFSLLNCNHFLRLSIKGYTQIVFKFPWLWAWIFTRFDLPVYGGSSSELSCLLLAVPGLNRFDPASQERRSAEAGCIVTWFPVIA